MTRKKCQGLIDLIWRESPSSRCVTAISGHARIVLPRGVVHLPCTAEHENWLVLCSAQRLRLAKIIGLIPLYDYIAQGIGYS